MVESVACPAIRTVRAECLTAWAQPMEALVTTAVEERRDLSSMSGILADTVYCLPPA